MDDDLQRQFDESMLALRDLIDFLRIDPVFLAWLMEPQPDFIVEKS